MTLTADVLPGVPLVESPLFNESLNDSELTEAERETARALNERGYAVIDFPDPDLEARADRIKARFAPIFDINLDDPQTIQNAAGDLRIQDAWRFDEDVKAIASNPVLIKLLSGFYGRRAFPFQTLNFPVGTQQGLHSDSVHFSSIPERFMCGVWVALEDIRPEAGPLVYVPGSHKWPLLNNAMINRAGWGSEAASAQTPFERVWEALISASGSGTERFLPRKGQALIWSANLLHGGDRQADRSITRWSQVTHYYFERCVYYTPAFSDEPLGRLDIRTVTNISTGEVEPNSYAGEEIKSAVPEPRRWRGAKWWRRKLFGPSALDLPSDFDPVCYQVLNPDAAKSGLTPADHYLRIGRHQGRQYSL